MLGDRLKAMREKRSWSQAHLAEAAELNIRTVQRIEAGETPSYETTLALAAALDCNISQLEPDRPIASGRNAVSSARMALAAVCVTPVVVFILVNLLRSAAGITGPYNLLASSGPRVVPFATFNVLSPIIFFGGAAVTLAICLPEVVRFRGRVDAGLIRLTGIEFRTRWLPVSLAAVSLISVSTLLAYVALEHIRSPLL